MKCLFFPFHNCTKGITGALVKGDVYKPTRDSVIVYFGTTDIDHPLASVAALNGKILYLKTFNEKYRFWVAGF